MYNLIEYSGNFSKTSGSLWNYYRDEVNDNANGNNDDDYRINNNKTTTSKSSEYKETDQGKNKKSENTPEENNRLDALINTQFAFD